MAEPKKRLPNGLGIFMPEIYKSLRGSANA